MNLVIITTLICANVSAANFNNLDVCPNPNTTVGKLDPSSTKINKSYADLKEGDSCKIQSIDTQPNGEGGYKSTGFVKWTLAKRSVLGDIWSVSTQRWGNIYVSYIESTLLKVSDAKEFCNRDEIIVLNNQSKKVQMSLPEAGFGRSHPENPLNYELLTSLNFSKVVPYNYERWYWTSTSASGDLGDITSHHLHGATQESLLRAGLDYLNMVTWKEGVIHSSFRCVGVE